MIASRRAALQVGAGVLVAVLLVIACEIVFLGKPFWSFHTTTGEIGGVVIGDTKEQAIARPGGSFSPQPKPIECPRNWIAVAEMSATERDCLLRSNEWRVGAVTSDLCPSWSSVSANLEFEHGKLVRVTTECRLAK